MPASPALDRTDDGGDSSTLSRRTVTWAGSAAEDVVLDIWLTHEALSAELRPLSPPVEGRSVGHAAQ